jgi:hypothetical protein
MIIGNFNKWKIVEDRRTLKAMEKRGLISQSEYSVFPQVDADLSQFVYKDRTYWIKYFEGSFFPFVVTLTDEYIENKERKIEAESLELDSESNGWNKQ